jgi:hypothetical protein
MNASGPGGIIPELAKDIMLNSYNGKFNLNSAVFKVLSNVHMSCSSFSKDC